MIETLKSYLANSYDFNILEFRCPKSGKVTRRITDEELTTLFIQCDSDLVKLAERLELLQSFGFTAFDWLVEDDKLLDIMRYQQPAEFFCYAIRQLVDTNKYYCQYRKRSNGMLTQQGRFLLQADFSEFCEAWDSLAGSLAPSLISELNEKLLLMLSIGGTSKLEELLGGELSFAWVTAQLGSQQLLPKLEKALNSIINSYKVKHNLPFDHKLTINDVNRIASQARQQALAESKARVEWIAKLQATKATYHQRVKTSRTGYKVTQVTSLMENLIGELQLANNDKQDYFNKLTAKRAALLHNGKPVAKLNSLAKDLANPKPVAQLKPMTFSFAKLVTKKEESNND